MSYHVCQQCGKHGEVTFNSTGFRHAYLATCDREDCPQTLAAKRFAAMFDVKQELDTGEGRFQQVNYSAAQRWRMVKEFHPRLKLEHWDGRAWQPLYGEEADKIVDAYILEAP